MSLLKKLFGGKEETKQEATTPQTREEKNFEVLKYDGIRAYNIGNVPYAIRCFEQAWKLKEDEEVAERLAEAYVRTDRTEEACSLVRGQLEKHPDEIRLLLRLGNLYYMQEEYALMVKPLQRVIELDPKEARAHYLLAKAYEGEKNPIQEIVELTQAIALKEDYSEAYLMRGTLLLEMGQTAEAESDAEKLKELQPDEEQTLILCGRIRYAQQKPEEVLDYFTQVVEQNPFNENAYVSMAQIHHQAERYTEAIQLLDDALEVLPQSSALYYYRGLVKSAAGDKEGSAEDVKRSMELAPEQEKQINGEYRNYEPTYQIKTPLG
jgi:tetratricopeptide (TPR) repeat protein